MSNDDDAAPSEWQPFTTKLTSRAFADAKFLDDLVPDARWFWLPLQRFCVPDCCEGEAYDFTPEFVRWVAHLSDEEQVPSSFRYDEVGDVPALAKDLRESAAKIRELPDQAVFADHVRIYATPDELAQLFEELAAALDA